MPMASTTPERVRVSSYQARIERSLTDHYYEVPETHQANRDWILTHVAHTNGYAICELCGHNPIKRLFFIKNRWSNQELMIGSECARNYASVDLVDAYMRTLQRDQNRVREAARRAERQAEIRARQQHYHEQRAAQDEERRVAFRASHTDLCAWMAVQDVPDNATNFVASVVRQYRERGTLSDRQVEVLERIRREEAERADAPRGDGARAGNARDRAATPDELTHIYNGDYTLTCLHTQEHLSFQIYTPRRGALQGLRIIKRMGAGGTYTGFAFLDRDGGLALWRRFQQDEHTQYVAWAVRLLSMLNQEQNAVEGIDEITNLDGSGVPWRIERSRRCRRCNARLTTPTSIHAGIGPECQQRNAEETRAASPFQVVEPLPDGTYVVTGDGPQRMNNNAAVADATARTARRRVPQPQQGETLLSELGSGELL